jgi:hypothetical protein
MSLAALPVDQSQLFSFDERPALRLINLYGGVYRFDEPVCLNIKPDT